MINHLPRLAALVDENKFNIPKTAPSQATFSTVMTFVFGAAGAIAVLVITIAGFQYVLSQGDPQKIAKAKNTIIYAVVGLIIAITGVAIVQFVINKVAP